MEKLKRLSRIFEDMDSVLVAFSGGCDSALVLKVAHDVLGNRAIAATAVSPAIAASEIRESQSLAAQIGAVHHLVQAKTMEQPDFRENSPIRCYTCKTDLYTHLSRLAHELHLQYLVNGTNRDDLGDYRPGLKAAREFGVRSPLLEAELDKSEVRKISRELGLSTWNKPADACLSSRVPFGTPITEERLGMVETAEEALKKEGFRQVRVRFHSDVARIEVPIEEFSRILDPDIRMRLVTKIKKAGFRYVTIDLSGYRQGSLNPEGFRKGMREGSNENQ